LQQAGAGGEAEDAVLRCGCGRRAGGRGGFQDPFGHNLLLEFARDNLSYQSKHAEKGTDRPLKVADIETFGRHFATYEWRGFDLLSMAVRSGRSFRRMRPVLETIDNAILGTFTPLQRYARFVITLVTN
jgi:hypothetical protein